MPVHPHPDQIARCIVQTFDALPAKFKPRKLSDGKREWVPLAGVVLSRKVKDQCKVSSEASSIHSVSTRDGIAGERIEYNNPISDVLTCAALATGMKCLPHSKLPFAQGAVLHDSHAEILALRAFNRFLLDECLALAQPATDPSTDHRHESPWIRWRASTTPVLAAHAHPITADPAASPLPPFELHDDISIHMFCSELPCGDASMELIMSEQADATPWATTNARSSFSPPAITLAPTLQDLPTADDAAAHATAMSPPPPPSSSSPPLPPLLPSQQQQQQLLGRGHFDRLGIVRRKPSRPDAPLALAKSCSDKLALKQCTGLLSAFLSLLVGADRCYLDTLVVPETGYVPAAMERAFGPEGRMRAALRQDGEESGDGEGGQEGGESKGWRTRKKEGNSEFRPRAFQVRTTKVGFAAAKRVPGDGDVGEVVPSNLSAVCTPHRREVLINGVRQGRKQSDLNGASCVSRRAMWADVAAVASLVGQSGLADAVDGRKTYGEVKACHLLEERERIKVEVRNAALKGWTRNSGDESWRLLEDDD